MRRPLSRLLLLGLLAFAGCGDDAAPNGGPSISLPGRDASTPDELDGGGCNTASDLENCGSCGNVCPGGPRGVATCQRGTCVLACEAGWGDCNGNVIDGCETDLTSNVAHCGACARDCRTCGGTTCANSACDVTDFATGIGPITLLDVDADVLTYATDTAVKQITRATIDEEHVMDVPFSTWLVMAKPNVLFIYPGTENASGIYATSAGFVGPQIAAYGRGESVDAFAYDETGAYYASLKPGGEGTQLLRCNNCSVPTVLSTTENRVSPGAIALDATTVFFGSADMVRRVEKTSDDLKTIAVGQSPRAMQIDASHLYWLNDDTNDLARLEKTGGDVEKLASGFERPRWLKLAGDRLYVGDKGVVSRFDKDGGARLDLARASEIGPIAVDQACVFFAVGSTVRRVTR